MNDDFRDVPPSINSGRRKVLKQAAATSALLSTPVQMTTAKAEPKTGCEYVQQLQKDYLPIPKQAPAREDVLPLSSNSGLYYWDTGGTGPAIVLSHPGSGSALSWPYQQPAFSALGFRTIAYSRRGHFGSPAGPAHDTGTFADDLNALITHLNIEQFHLIGLAAGGFVVSDFAVSYPEKLHSMVIACSLFGLWDEAIKQRADTIRAQGLQNAPPEFRELGASYRWAHPEGVKEWLEMHEKSKGDGKKVRQRPKSEISWKKLQSANIPLLLLSGGADLYQPPAMMYAAAQHLSNCETRVIPEVGHAIQWEQPKLFNQLIIDFISKNS